MARFEVTAFDNEVGVDQRFIIEAHDEQAAMSIFEATIRQRPFGKQADAKTPILGIAKGAEDIGTRDSTPIVRGAIMPERAR